MDGTILGKGAFGNVIARGGYAVKEFNSPKTDNNFNHLVQEIVVSKYLSDSPYIVHTTGYDLGRLEISMEKCDISLRDAIIKYQMTYDEKYQIFIDILRGLDNIHSRNLVHSDLKPSNVLLMFNPLRVRIGDLGLSSTEGFGKLKQTAKGYRPPDKFIDPNDGEGHDMFSCAIVGVELFTEYRFYEQVTPNRLAKVVDEVNIGKIRHSWSKKLSEGLKMLARGMHTVKGKPERCSVYHVLEYLTGEIQTYPIPPIASVDNYLNKYDSEFLYEEMRTITVGYRIRRGKRGYQVLLNRINCKCEKCSLVPVDRSNYPIYVVAISLILSSLFGHPGFNERKALYAVNRKWKLADLQLAVRSFIDCQNSINYLMLV